MRRANAMMERYYKLFFSKEAQELIEQNKIYSEYTYKEIMILLTEYTGFLQYLKNENLTYRNSAIDVLKKHIKDLKKVKKYYELSYNLK
jgi:hypothetical protein